jgi:hypothetical protein
MVLWRLTLSLGLIAMFGAPLCADTWYFKDTMIQGAVTGNEAAVTGFVTVTGTNWDFPINITLTGVFPTVLDSGSGLQLDEGDSSYVDTDIDFITTQPTETPGLTVDPLLSFTYVNFSGTTETYSLVSGELTKTNPNAPEAGTAFLMLTGGLALAAGFKLRRS